ncbi:2-C-methyl-D-erythritol 4-phosphate cytidylyltransferase [uncultured Nocardioides sp.]|uniref:2-C-methyl-D-erythritol 4-phosphate cytidylyltransferase n=1 Tax=uncultured Nocardioides sp. TaxID=198441 RepID=UPI002632B048|nr:2-C-methyl-D-erythritol 4-phosphate cytidylyltransferase [uncultured Nocardioides sp.]
MQDVLYDEDGSLGVVVETERGSLPFVLLHGEALVACAAWALGEAGVTQVDIGTGWAALVEAEEPVVLHDPLCPMTPADFIASCVERCAATQAVVVAVRPVTDTLKSVDGDGVVEGTVDRETMRQVTSPIVLPASVVAGLEGLPSTDFATLAAELASRYPVVTMQAPPEGRRVGDEDDVRVLEALTAR